MILFQPLSLGLLGVARCNSRPFRAAAAPFMNSPSGRTEETEQQSDVPADVTSRTDRLDEGQQRGFIKPTSTTRQRCFEPWARDGWHAPRISARFEGMPFLTTRLPHTSSKA